MTRRDASAGGFSIRATPPVAATHKRPCESIFIPGLFDGLAGIGYQMLRLAAPDRVPSVLLWE